MIADAIEFIRKEVRNHLGVSDEEVIINTLRTLSEDAAPSGVFISLVNVQEETALRNTPHVERRNGQLLQVEPAVYLNLYLLFAFKFLSYNTSLIHLSRTVELFQLKSWFSAETQTAPGAIDFPNALEKLLCEMVNMNFEELNNLWGVLGGSYFPSVVYKVRMVKVQSTTVKPAPEFKILTLKTGLT